MRGVPPGSVCYVGQPNYDQSACEHVRTNWFNAAFHAEYSVSIGFPYWADNPCPPIFPNGTSLTGDVNAGRKGCSIGRYPAYVVNATRNEEVQAALKFAAKKGIRVNIKSTGLSLQGRSSAFGSLSYVVLYGYTHGFANNSIESGHTTFGGSRSMTLFKLKNVLPLAAMLLRSSLPGKRSEQCMKLPERGIWLLWLVCPKMLGL